jgi:hypothetical protein
MSSKCVCAVLLLDLQCVRAAKVVISCQYVCEVT